MHIFIKTKSIQEGPMNNLWKELFVTMAVVAGGCYLYVKYKGKPNRELAAASMPRAASQVSTAF